jgi:hypothetical protein
VHDLRGKGEAMSKEKVDPRQVDAVVSVYSAP